MKIVVLVKQVPDSGLERRLGVDQTIDRDTADNVVNEMDEYALEEALRIQEGSGAEVVLVTVGPAGALATVRKALQLGGDRAVHVVDDAIAGSCVLGTSAVLAAAIASERPDLVICGAISTDGGVQVMPHMIAERLGVAAVTGARKIEIRDREVLVERQTEQGSEHLAAELPAVVSVWDTINTPRYPSFKGIMAAKKKPVVTLTLADLGIDPATVGFTGASTRVVDHERRSSSRSGTIIVDDGQGGQRLADYLAANKFV